MMNLLICPLIFIVLFYCFAQADGASYRYSYRSYRYSSYRSVSYRTSTSYRSTSYRYTVNNDLKARYGGLSYTQKIYVFRTGIVYIPPFYRAYIRTDKDLSDNYAICEGTLFAPPMNNTSLSLNVDEVKYSYFTCPSTYLGLDQYCCEAAPNQTCCSWEEFSSRYGYYDSIIGSTAGMVVGIVLGLIIVGALITFCACRRYRAQGGRVVQPPQAVTSTPVIQNEYQALNSTSGETSVYPMGPQYPSTGIQYQSVAPSYPSAESGFPLYPPNANSPPNYESAMTYPPQSPPYGGAGSPMR